MTDPRTLFAQYLRQRADLGDTRLFRTHDDMAAAAAADAGGEAEPDAPVAEAPTVSAQTAAVGPEPTGDAVSDKWREGAPEIPPAGLVIPHPEENLFEPNPLAEAALDDLVRMIGQCERCALCEGRTNAVPGEGPPDARLMVVGEGPGATEDETGRPFVGRAGQLLTDILTAIDLPRERVYIANIVKCRPPNNRNPETTEIEACLPYLHRQIALIQPSVILAMGGVAATTLLNSRGSLGSLRNRVHEFRGIPLIVTYHPAALLRNPQWKKPTWDDVRIARRLLAGDR